LSRDDLVKTGPFDYYIDIKEGVSCTMVLEIPSLICFKRNVWSKIKLTKKSDNIVQVKTFIKGYDTVELVLK
jgi:hypothetical protein